AIEARATRAAEAAQARLTEVQGAYDAERRKLDATTDDLRATRARLTRLRARLERSREVLSDVLRARYAYEPPQIVDIVLSSDGFSDLMERVTFLRRIQTHDTRIVDEVRDARNDAASDENRLQRLRKTQARQTEAAGRQRDAIASMAAGLEERRADAARAHAARQQALRNTRASRRGAERSLAKLEAAEARRARQYTAPSSAGGSGASGGSGSSRAYAKGTGGWAIPWAIVQCESGGVNHPPNHAGASGYYQFMPATWQAMGGSTPNAYQASKAEQDRLAAKLWNGGAGASNWDCAAIVGITG
ncbi:MAG: transglycosylase family protein, partial [Solirubrobacteraceae bacterium]